MPLTQATPDVVHNIQSNITQVGTLTSLAVTGAVTTSNIASDSHNFANGVSIVTTLNTTITTANTAMKGYVDGQISTTSSSITTANTAMKGYVDAVTTAWTANAATQAGLIADLTSNAAVQSGAIVTANTAMKGYVDAINTTLTANLGAVSGSLATLTSNAAVQAGSIASTNTAITTANTAMKGYVDSRTTYTTSHTSTSGYVVLPNGTIIQWAAQSGYANFATRPFPMTFPNACVSVVVNGTGTSQHWEAYTIYAFTTSTWTGYTRYSSDPSMMIAIGY